MQSSHSRQSRQVQLNIAYYYLLCHHFKLGALVKFILPKKATKIDEIFTVDLTVTTYCQIDDENVVNLCGLLRKRWTLSFASTTK